jgi:hypothetical protein
MPKAGGPDVLRRRLGLALAVIVGMSCPTLATLGCSTTPVRPDPLAARFHSPAALQARTSAPDLYARAQRAASEGAKAKVADARQHHTERAALLLEAAIAESRRLAAESAAADAEARWASAVEQRARFERERQELESQLERTRAGRLADARFERARTLEPSGRARTLQPSERALEPRANPGDALSTQEAAEVLRERALLVLAAATAFGLEPARSTALELTIARAARKPDAVARLGATRAVLRDAESALRDARDRSR